ncbi:M15 family metallopeptidase [Glaciimonas soli]|uniref:M15 family peptidase n=1 Tax=Glaciimonas soli TaxID=2590999 RepID=A0A843YRG0_9BURK|nr:M15 family metallopeptidase [Glaciimonas soli]MQR00314.1 M15 family peptidase [Glaciimonas soli]
MHKNISATSIGKLILGAWTATHFCIAAAAPLSSAFATDAAACAQLKSDHVMQAGAPVTCEQLQTVRFSFIDFDGKLHDDGEVMVMAAVAPQVQAIFEELLARRLPIKQARLMGHYHGDDDASMADNNTSAFNDRAMTGGGALSLHAYGLAIDLNPLQNPYINRNKQGAPEVSPPAGQPYTARTKMRPGMVNQQIADVFAQHGFFIWGGNWKQPIDYQHFQVSRKMAERLAALPSDQARKVFESSIIAYGHCMKNEQSNMKARVACVNDK